MYCPHAILAGQPWHGLCPSHTASRNMHGIVLMTVQGSSSSLGPLPKIHVSGLLSEWLLQFEAIGQS